MSDPSAARKSLSLIIFIALGLTRSICGGASVNRRVAYEELRRALGQGLARDVEKGVDAAEVAACVSRIVASEAPKLRHLVGREATRLRVLKTLLPAGMFEWGLRRRDGLVKAPGEIR
jgi:hypothetical protein